MEILHFPLGNYLHQMYGGILRNVSAWETDIHKEVEAHFVLATYQRIFPRDLSKRIEDYYQEIGYEATSVEYPEMGTFLVFAQSDFDDLEVLCVVEDDFEVEISIETVQSIL